MAEDPKLAKPAIPAPLGQEPLPELGGLSQGPTAGEVGDLKIIQPASHRLTAAAARLDRFQGRGSPALNR